MRVHARVAAVVAAAAVLVAPSVASGAELPRGPVTAQTVAAAQAEAAALATASTDAARAAAEAGVALDAAKAAAQAAAAVAAADPTPANVAAAAAATAAQATAQQNFDAKTAAAAKAAADATAAQTNAAREAASFAKLSNGAGTEGTPSPTLPADDTALPASQQSENVDYVGHVNGGLAGAAPATGNWTGSCPAFNPAGCPGYSALNFIRYENLGYDVLVANGTAGLSVWSLKDPAHPKFISQVPVSALGAKTGETLARFWEGENMTVDSRRKLAFLSKDQGTKGILTVDLKDPWNPIVVGFQPTPLGHTATCLNDCRFIWQVGGGVSGRRSAVAVTDIRDIEHPFTYANVFEAAVRRTSSTSGSTHSVDVDFDGVAWVSGTGGVRGWWTEGLHKDTATGQDRYATPYDPLPYGGGSVAGSTGSFMHNAYRVPQALGSEAAGDVMLITNEANSTRCQNAGLFIISSLRGTRDVENNLPPGPVTSPALMPRLATYSTFGKPGEFIDPTRAIGDCSAHWFTVKGNIVALGNYEQGTRFVDISNPTSPQQVGWFRVPQVAGANTRNPQVKGSNTASAIWHGRYVYVSDYARGIDVLKYNGAIPGPLQPKTCWNSCADNQNMEYWGVDQTSTAGANVPATLSLTLGTPASFGAFTPGVAQTYSASSTASVISTAGDAILSVADPASGTTGHLVNGAFSLPSALQARATSAAGTGAALADVGGSAAPTSLLTYNGPISNDTVSLAFQQRIGVNDALRTGSYSKTLTFTLSTTTP